jgi:hypothetical protein
LRRKKMKNSISAAILGAAVTTTLIGLSTSPAQAAQLSFKFDFVTFPDGDLFKLNLTTEDTLTTVTVPAYTDLISGLTSPAYTFTGYKILGVTGTETDPGGITNPITAILPEYTNIAAVGDLIPHSPTDNLYNPNGGFAPGVLPAGYKAGNFSFGGLAFHVGGTENEDYQVFTRSDFGSTFNRPGPGYGYGGCPGSCVGAIPVPEPSSTAGLLAIGSFGALGAASTLKRKLKSSKPSEKETTKVG